MAGRESADEDAADVRLFMEVGIILVSGLAGWIWTGALSGALGGLLLGVSLVLTARLGRMR